MYLITAQHSSVAILSCSLKRRWLDMIAEDPQLLKGYAEQRVFEYGPVDLIDPDARALFVKMVYILLIYSKERSKIEQSIKVHNEK